MQMVNSAQLAVLASSVVTVGSFDGVHRGHRHLLRTLRRVANRTQLKTTLVTFDPIPRTVVHPEIALPLICSVQTRLRLLRQTGCVDHCCVVPFNLQMQSQAIDEFIVDNLMRRFGMRVLVVGQNFACGRGREGDVAYLTELGKQHNFSVEVQLLHAPHGLQRCSSTEARRLIQQGELPKSRACLIGHTK